MAKPKLKVEKIDTKRDVIYATKVNHDTASGIYFAVVLMGDNITYSKINGKKIRWWNRFAEGSSMGELMERMTSNENLNGATDEKGNLLTPEDIISMIVPDEIFTNAFYSNWCLHSNYENMEDREKAEVIFNEFNVPKVLYSRARNNEFFEIFKEEFSKIFRVQKMLNIMKFLLHTTRTEIKELKKMEVK